MHVRLAGIGLGGLGDLELGVYDDIEGVEIVAGADVGGPQREQFEAAYDAPAYESVADMLAAHADELDAANVATPHTLHHEHARACLDAGLHAFVEKPMTTDVRDAVDLVETAAARDLALAVGYQRHFDPRFEALKRAVDEEIGDVHAVTCYLGQEWIAVQDGTWRTDPGLSGGGQLYDSGSHLLDAMLWTTGTTPRSVAAVLDRRGHDVDVNAALAATLDRDGRQVTASIGVTGDGADPEPADGLLVWGTDGRAELRGERLVVEAGGSLETAAIEEIDFHEVTRRKLVDFLAAVEEGTKPAVPGEYGLEVTALTEAAYEAAETGRTVDVRSRLDGVRATVESPSH